jgi:glycosyltransferase involved in cell wall biosynthesis
MMSIGLMKWPPLDGNGVPRLPSAPEVGSLKILLWHGYLLGGTGSNVYTRSLARFWSRMGHEVIVFCQEADPRQFDLGTAEVVRPEIGGILPVFVLDRYRDLEPRLLQDLTPTQRDDFVEANASALKRQLPADLVFTNHALLGAPVGAAVGAPYAVKVHGSELEFSMRGNPELCRWANDTLSGAAAIFAGSEHIRETLREIVGPGAYTSRIHVVSPGVDVDLFRPKAREDAFRALLAEARRDPDNPSGAPAERLPDPGNAARLERFLRGAGATIVYFGKLSQEKGVHLLIQALGGCPARTVIVGFGEARAELEAAADAIAPGRVLFTGALEHRHLVNLLPLADITVVPSLFPEAFGMVAAEAAAAGSIPLVAHHSGLVEIAEGLEAEYPDGYGDLTRFIRGDVEDLSDRLQAILALHREQRAQLRASARRAAVRLWSWEHVSAALLEASGFAGEELSSEGDPTRAGG